MEIWITAKDPNTIAFSIIIAVISLPLSFIVAFLPTFMAQFEYSKGKACSKAGTTRSY